MSDFTKRYQQLRSKMFGFKHRAMKEKFGMLNTRAEKGGVVFVGDSITEEFPLHELLTSELPIYNRGISGDKTTGVFNKLKEEVFDLEPKKVFLLVGTNDLGEPKPYEEVAEGIRKIVIAIKEKLPNVELYLQSIFPVNEPDFADVVPRPTVGYRKNDQIRLTNQEIEKIAKEVNATYIDLYPKLANEKGRLHPDYSYDGLHLSAKGYFVVADELQKYL